jgi:hypothetical protein
MYRGMGRHRWGAWQPAGQRQQSLPLPLQRRQRPLSLPLRCPAASADILPSDPALLAKAKLFAEIWGSYIGPAQASAAVGVVVGSCCASAA